MLYLLFSVFAAVTSELQAATYKLYRFGSGMVRSYGGTEPIRIAKDPRG